MFWNKIFEMVEVIVICVVVVVEVSLDSVMVRLFVIGVYEYINVVIGCLVMIELVIIS